MSKPKQKKKLNCKDIEKKFHSYLDGEMKKGEFILLEQHLDYCLPCDKKIEFEKKLRDIVKLKGKENIIPEKLLKELEKIIHSA
jgi:mycothiol system anti-sigma-R factor